MRILDSLGQALPQSLSLLHALSAVVQRQCCISEAASPNSEQQPYGVELSWPFVAVSMREPGQYKGRGQCHVSNGKTPTRDSVGSCRKFQASPCFCASFLLQSPCRTVLPPSSARSSQDPRPSVAAWRFLPWPRPRMPSPSGVRR